MLPRLKEKVAAVLLLLIVSATMLTTVSFAWLSLSTSPEVSGVNTTIASNGNLEIALVGPEGSIPAISAEGDSNLPLIERNITWGNLINLSDPSYGLDNMTLRPARLNKSDLTGSPLYGAVYSEDGRAEELASNFAYASWELGKDGNGQFIIPENAAFGVRAISSTKVGSATDYQYQYQEIKSDVTSANAAAANKYIEITSNKAWMESLATIMGTYMTNRMAASDDPDTLKNPTIKSANIQNMRDMYAAFIETFELEEKALVELANFQLFVINNNTADGVAREYTPFTAETLRSNMNSLSSYGVKITDLKQFYSDYDVIKNDYERLVYISGLGDVQWDTVYTFDDGNHDVNGIIGRIVNIGSCTLQTIDGSSGDPVTVNSIGASNAMTYNNKSCYAIITNGILKRFEERTGEYMNVGKNYNGGQGLLLTATARRLGITMDGKIYALISTNATKTSHFSTDIKYAEGMNKGGAATLVAKDIYGMAIDLWVRTNARGSYLTLEGNILTESKTVRDTAKDANGNEVFLYSVSVTREFTEEVVNEETGETETVTQQVTETYDLYKVETKGEGDEVTVTWYRADTHSVFTPEEGVEPKEKYKEVQTVIGYEGENRVWDGSSGLSVNSTTQGSGSCYVYYADTPEDQARSLKLLEAMKVVFIDSTGTQLAIAEMATDKYYANNGKVIVPLVLGSDSLNLGEDINGNEVLAITELEQNVPFRITALIYLDGDKLNNSDVLSAADIQGQLNIQFGSSVDLNHFENEELKYQEMTITASIDKTEFDFDTATEDNPMTTNVTVKVDGTQPKTLTAFFIRTINSTQGSREGTMTFTYDEASDTWLSSYTFTSPGDYVLRTVSVDGIEYDLDMTTLPTVHIEGFTVTQLTWESVSNHITYMTADKTVSTDLSLKFASSDVNKMPKTVVGRFIREEDGSVANVIFTYNPTTASWNGSVTFNTSGEYSLQYVVLDGEYQELNENMQKSATVYLGMKVAVYTESPTSFLYKESEMTDNMKNLTMNVVIMDDTGNPLPGRSGVKLYYKSRTSALIENGLNTDLIWDGEYYTGTFKSKIGMYDFYRVDVTTDTGTNTITHATTSPSFIITSPKPPTFDSDVTPDYQYSPVGATGNDIAKFSFKLNDAEALPNITAIITKNGVELEEPVIGVADTTGNWTFAIPADVAGSRDGVWAVKEIRIWGLEGEDNGVAYSYTEEAPLVFDLSNSGKTTKVVSVINNLFINRDDLVLEGEFLKQFLISSFEVNPFAMSITDFENKPVDGLDTITLSYNYKKNMSEMGGYTIDAAEFVEGEFGDFTITLKRNSDKDSTYDIITTCSVNSLMYAGTYELVTVDYRFSFDDGETYYDIKLTGESLPNAADIIVDTDAPTVTVEAVSPVAGETFSTTRTSGGLVGEVAGVYNTISANKDHATVYMKGEKSGWGFWGYTMPSVTLKLSGVANYTSASLTMVNAADTATTHVFSFAPGAASNTQKIGRSAGQTAAHDTKYLAGKTTFTEIPIIYNGVTYTVQLSMPVTIEQPESPYVLSFGNIPSNIPSDDRPDPVTAEGSTVTLTFPKLTWVETTAADPVYSDWSGWAKNADIRTDYSTNKKITTKHYYFIWTEYINTRTVTGETTAQNMEIASWTIDGVTYYAGKTYTITLSGDTVATANPTKVGKTYSLGTTTTTETEYRYGYVAGATYQSNTPTGGKLIATSSGLSSSVKSPQLYSADNYTSDINGYEQFWP